MKKTALLTLALVAVSVSAHADSITLNATADLRILSFAPGESDNSEGLATFNSGSGNDQRTLIEFDYSALAGLNIQSATLRMFGISFSGSGALTSIDLYRVTDPWVETTASWSNRDTGSPWTNAGGDAVGTTGSQLTNPYTHWVGNGSNLGTWFEFDATSLVTGAVSGGNANDGFLLDGASGNQLVFVSREGHTFQNMDPTNVPQLVVTYTAAPEPASCVALGALAVSAIVRRRALSKRQVT